jgi:hypothetical protein
MHILLGFRSFVFAQVSRLVWARAREPDTLDRVAVGEPAVAGSIVDWEVLAKPPLSSQDS